MWEVRLTMSDHATRRRGALRVAPAVLGLLLALSLPAADAMAGGAGPVTRTVYRGSAWGTMLKQHQGVESGHSAPATLSCLTKPGQAYRNSVASIRAPQNVFHTGLIVDKAESLPIQDGAETAQSTSVIHDVSMIQGFIHAQVDQGRHCDQPEEIAPTASASAGSPVRPASPSPGRCSPHPLRTGSVELPGLGR
jgi:hypothetical protein